MVKGQHQKREKTTQRVKRNIQIIYLIRDFYTKNIKNFKKTNNPSKWAVDPSRQYADKDICVVNKQMRRSSILAIQEMKITRLRYHLASPGMAIIKKTAKCGQECGEIRILLHSLWEYEMLLLLWETIWKFVKRLSIELLYNPAIPLLGVYPREVRAYVLLKTSLYTNVSTQVKHCSSWPKCGENPDANKLIKCDNGHTAEYYSAIKRNTILIHHTPEMNLENSMLSERS